MSHLPSIRIICLLDPWFRASSATVGGCGNFRTWNLTSTDQGKQVTGEQVLGRGIFPDSFFFSCFVSSFLTTGSLQVWSIPFYQTISTIMDWHLWSMLAGLLQYLIPQRNTFQTRFTLSTSSLCQPQQPQPHCCLSKKTCNRAMWTLPPYKSLQQTHITRHFAMASRGRHRGSSLSISFLLPLPSVFPSPTPLCPLNLILPSFRKRIH